MSKDHLFLRRRARWCRGKHMIEDLELRSLFKTESEEHLRLLEAGLLSLESDPTDGKTLEEVFRGAHSLKGGAGMLGLRNIERVAHGFEDVLNAARQGKVVLSSGAIDELCKQLDTMRLLVDQAVSDAPAGVTTAGALTPTLPLEASSGRYRIDTMRVEPQKLDALMKQASELTVAKILVARRLTQIEELVTLCEEWSREVFAT